jgi:hypothetical protein
MKKWLALYEVDSNLSIQEVEEPLHYVDCKRSFEIIIRNHPDRNELSGPKLNVIIILENDSIDNVSNVAEMYVNEFIHLLSFITNSPYHIRNQTLIFDWTEADGPRSGRHIQVLKNIQKPIPALNSQLIESISLIQSLAGR